MSLPFILVVDDEPDIRDSVKDILEDEGYGVSVAENGEAARAALRERRPDLILLDIWMPDIDGISLLKEWSEGDGLPCPVIIMSGHGTVETAVEATRLGAYDFLEKPLSLAKLLLTVERALETERLVMENVGLRRSYRPIIEPVGHSQVMQRLREQVKRVAQHDTWVLISGEAGSGRETFARYLHAQSSRKERPFIDVSVGATAKGNFSLEFFGSEHDGKIHYGRLEQANGGTLFLDEVADMDLEAQAQLAGAFETGEFLRVGGSDPVKVDIRVIAATQKDLQVEVSAGNFREDFFYHLNVVPLEIPPLREHREDVPELLGYYVDYFVSHEKLPYRHFSVSAQNMLRNYDWHGNILELRNLVQRVLILGAGDEITLDDVEAAMGGLKKEAVQTSLPGISFDQPLRKAREDFERVYLEYQLYKHDGNVSKMAQEVGMERTHLYRKLRGVGIEIKDRR
ncbi:sigma-54-dependent transcriptional regulator [Thiolapillus brandeum]|uniref:Two-component response regulator n=1 Tax=Thiolapillus brandeum TaxID=1076588 RepID=A0A7U6JH00_9GAMM|nr:sigma-54 dependent transcriptional regulator [Thiolapillus brandeum]BAO43357.1 two-component response regulator [Thiolapillus brandeum]